MKTKHAAAIVFTTAAASLLIGSQDATAQRRAASIPVPSDDRDRRPRPQPDTQRGREFQFPNEIRRIDGYGNNLANPGWGMAHSYYLRRVPADYADGVSEPSGANRPSPRVISNVVAIQLEPIPNAIGASDFLWQWGQFVDHDIDETPTVDPAEPFDIAVPAGDAFFDPQANGTTTIGLNRSDYEMVDGVRQQINGISAYIDGSNVYGSDEQRAFALRTLDGTGRLATSDGNLLPFNTDGLANAPSAFAPNFFLAGDVRANEQAGLTTLHTLFVREHNYWADSMAEANSSMSGDEIYQSARAMVAAELQAITYREFLPVLLGQGAIPEYRGYSAETNAGIANGFAAAAYRLGHSMLPEELQCLDAQMQTIPSGNLALTSAFFDPSLMSSIGLDPILRGLCNQRCQELDNQIVDGVRNFLFGAPGAGGFDLASLNIQRGRDHGIAPYNEVREAYGLRPVRGFSEINRDTAVSDRLSAVYVSVDDIDAWVGMLAEQHVRGAMVGQTLRAVLVDQFTRLRDGDRFWYERYLQPELVRIVEQQTLATVIRRNTEIGDEISDNVFLVVLPGI